MVETQNDENLTGQRIGGQLGLIGGSIMLGLSFFTRTNCALSWHSLTDRKYLDSLANLKLIDGRFLVSSSIGLTAEYCFLRAKKREMRHREAPAAIRKGQKNVNYFLGFLLSIPSIYLFESAPVNDHRPGLKEDLLLQIGVCGIGTLRLPLEVLAEICGDRAPRLGAALNFTANQVLPRLVMAGMWSVRGMLLREVWNEAGFIFFTAYAFFAAADAFKGGIQKFFLTPQSYSSPFRSELTVLSLQDYPTTDQSVEPPRPAPKVLKASACQGYNNSQ